MPVMSLPEGIIQESVITQEMVQYGLVALRMMLSLRLHP